MFIFMNAFLIGTASGLRALIGLAAVSWAAHSRTGIAAADFSRIRHADLGRFTIDRLMGILNRLGSRIDVRIRVRRSASPRNRGELGSAGP